MRDPPAWAALVGLGRLYGLAGDVFRDDFSPETAEEWTEAWREALSASGLGDSIASSSNALLAAIDEARTRLPDARAERSRLLLLGGCPAYETAYVGAFARQRELSDIAGFYAAAGLRATGERQDHLAVECEFVSLLCVKEAAADASGRPEEAERCRDMRRKFLRDHLGTWVGLYGDDVASRGRLALFPRAAAAIRDLVARDAEALGVAIHERERPGPDPEAPAPQCGPLAAGPAPTS